MDLLAHLVRHWKRLVLAPLVIGLGVYLGAAWLPPGYTAKSSFLPPQQQGTSASMLASLGPLAASLGLPGSRSPADQYLSLMRSETVMDRIIDRFDLMKSLRVETRRDARLELTGMVRISLGRKDGLIYIEADGPSPQLAADLANAHVEELSRLLNRLSLTEAQQRRAFFEAQLQAARDRLGKAQASLQQSGFTQGALQAEPRAAAEGYAKLRAEVTAAEVRAQSMRGFMNETAPEYRQALITLQALRDQLAKVERRTPAASDDANYIERFREFKYQETLFELFARQYEIARVDESRESGLIQVVDKAQPPEKQSAPRKARLAASVTLLASFAVLFVLLFQVIAAQLRRPDSQQSAWRRLADAARDT